MEKYLEQTSQVRRSEADERSDWQTCTKKGAQQLQQTRDHPQMWPLRQKLSLPHRSLQPQETLPQPSKQPGLGCFTHGQYWTTEAYYYSWLNNQFWLAVIFLNLFWLSQAWGYFCKFVFCRAISCYRQTCL